MSDVTLRPWLVRDVQALPYPERREPPLHALDTALHATWKTVRPYRVEKTERFKDIVGEVEAQATRMSAAADHRLAGMANDLRLKLRIAGLRRDLVGEAFALVGEASARFIGLRHYPVQFIGGLVMLHGRMAEMATGEGKTITAMLPAVTAALCGIPVHIITVNDYLAKRDYEWLRPVYEILGLTVGLVQHGQEPLVRKSAYACDVTYCTNKEVAFDYLRDRIALRAQKSVKRSFASFAGNLEQNSILLLRGLYFGVVDEADSVLIDEARTPLIISSDADRTKDDPLYRAALRFAEALVEAEDYNLEKRDRAAKLTSSGSAKLADFTRNLNGPWRAKRAREELVEKALTALRFFERDKHYIVAGDEVQIVDEFTGRVMPDRSWEHGLHQLIEAKEQQPVSGLRTTLAQITYQQFFRRYLWLAGMTGTAAEVARELASVYELRVVRVPTNRPLRRIHQGVRVFKSAHKKWDAVVASASKRHRIGQPVLIGTRSVATSELISERLDRSGLTHVVLNARQDADEAEIVAAAGTRGKITVATNMAGRGTDIRLAPGIAELGGLHVILTEFHESSRIDRQLFGRAGRQGDPGSYEAIVSLEDEIFRRFSQRFADLAGHWILDESSPLQQSLASLLRRKAQSSAEAFNLKARQETMRRYKRVDKALAFAGQPE